MQHRQATNLSQTIRIIHPRAEAKQMAKRQRRQEGKAHHELASYLDKEASSTQERENRWAAENAREALREERW